MDKIAVLSHIVPPAPSGQATVLYRLLKALPPDRYTLLTRMPDTPYAQDERATEKLPGEYRHLKPFLQVPVLKFAILKELAILLNAFLGILARSCQITAAIRKGNFCLLIACTGDLYDLPAGYVASVKTRTPFVPYVFDDYIYQWNGIYRSLARYFEPHIMRYSRGVLVTNEFMRREYHDRYGIEGTVIHNPCELPSLQELDRKERILDPDRKHIVYTGAIYHAQLDSFLILIEAIGLLGRDDIIVDIFTSQSESSLRKEGITGPMVRFHPHIHSSMVPCVLRQADILFLPLAFHSAIPEVIRTSAPGKTGEYLSVGRPILVHAPRDSFLSWFFREHACGLVVDECDPQALCSAIQELVMNRHPGMAMNARSAAEHEFDITLIQSHFHDFLSRFEQ
jgi:glycosyltransferase involved in cell wall biosynthesis